MLVLPEHEYIYRVLGIDNGTDTLGTVIADIDIRRDVMDVVHAETCTASKTANRWQSVTEIHGARFARYRALRLYLDDLLEEHQPDAIIVEGPFMHIHAESFAKLRESLYMIREAAMEYHPLVQVHVVAPMSAKKAVKAKHYDKGKDPVRDAVLALKDVYYDDSIDPHILDEHTIDAIAVAYYEKQQTMEMIHRRRT